MTGKGGPETQQTYLWAAESWSPQWDQDRPGAPWGLLLKRDLQLMTERAYTAWALGGPAFAGSTFAEWD